MAGEAGASYLASIFGTEKDKVNCSFYFKTGACRHGQTCSRAHNQPPLSQTLLIRNLYHGPPADGVAHPTEQVEDFYQDVFDELSEHGNIVDMVVCANAGPHLAGNVYAKFVDEVEASKALAAIQGRYYGGHPIMVEYTPVSDFWEGICKQLEREGRCARGLQCNFMHLHHISKKLEYDLYPRGRAGSRHYSGGAYGRESDRDDRYHDRGRSGGGGGGGYHDRRHGGGGGGGYHDRGGYDRRGGGGGGGYHDRGGYGGGDRGGYDRGGYGGHQGGGGQHHQGGGGDFHGQYRQRSRSPRRQY